MVIALTTAQHAQPRDTQLFLERASNEGDKLKASTEITRQIEYLHKIYYSVFIKTPNG